MVSFLWLEVDGSRFLVKVIISLFLLHIEWDNLIRMLVSI
jgi:hypothetical protein